MYVVGRCLVDLELMQLMSATNKLEGRIDSLITELRTSREMVLSARVALELDELLEQAEADAGYWIFEVARAAAVDQRSLEPAIQRFRALEERDFCAGILALLLLVLELKQTSPSRVGEDAPAALLAALDDYRLEGMFIGRAFDSELGTAIVLHLSSTWPDLEVMPLLRQLSPYDFFECLRRKDWVRPFFPGAAKLLYKIPEIFDLNGYSFDQPLEWVECAANLGELAVVAELVRTWAEPRVRASAGAKVAAVLAGQGLFEEALDWFTSSEGPPATFLAGEADRQRKLGNLQRARYLTAQIPDAKVRLGSFARLAWDFLRRREVRDALECLRSVTSSIEEPGDLGLILAEAPGLNEPGRNPGDLALDFDTLIQELWGWTHKEPGEVRNELQCSLIEITGYLGNKTKAWQMTNLVEASRDRAVVIASLLAWDSGESDAAARLDNALGEARALRIRWESCSALLHVAFAASRIAPERARELFAETFALAREIADVRGLVLSVQRSIAECLAEANTFTGCNWCYFEILELVAEAQDLANHEPVLSAALLLREKIDSAGERARWVRRFIEVAAACNAKDALKLLARQSATLELLDEVMSCLEKVSESQRIDILASLAEQLWHQDRTNALRFLAEAESLSRKPARERYEFPQYKVIAGLAGLGLWDRAIDLASSVGPAEERCQAFAKLTFLSLDNLGMAQQMLVAFLKTGQRRDLRARWPFDADALAALAGELAKLDPNGRLRVSLFDWALSRIQLRVPDESQRILWLVTWFRQVVENLPIQEARPLLDDAQYRLLELKDQRVRDEGIAQIARVLLRVGELGWVCRLAEALASKYAYASLLCDLALIEAREGKEREAAGHLSGALGALAEESLRSDGSPQQVVALPAIRALQDHELRGQTLKLALAPLLRIELDTERAKALLKLGEELAAGEPDPWVAQILVELCLQIERAEMPRYALELEELRIGLLASLGEFDEALAATKSIDQSSWQREGALLRIVRELIRQGHTASYFPVFAKLKSNQYKVEALKVIALEASVGEAAVILPTLLQEVAKIEDTILQLEILETLSGDKKWKAASAEIQERLEAVENRLHSLLKYTYPGRGLTAMARLWVRLGKEQRALALLRRADAGDMAVPALQALIEMASSMTESTGWSCEREAWFAELTAIIENLDSTASVLHLLTQLAGAQVHAGLIEAAGRVFEKALILAEQAEMLEAAWIEQAAKILETPFDKQREWATRLLDNSDRVDPKEQMKAISSLAKARLIPEGEAAGRLESLRESLRLEYLRVLRKAIFEDSANRVADTLKTFGIAPATTGTGTSGVVWLGAALLRDGEMGAYQELVQAFPGGCLPSIDH